MPVWWKFSTAQSASGTVRRERRGECESCRESRRLSLLSPHFFHTTPVMSLSPLILLLMMSRWVLCARHKTAGVAHTPRRRPQRWRPVCHPVPALQEKDLQQQRSGSVVAPELEWPPPASAANGWEKSKQLVEVDLQPGAAATATLASSLARRSQRVRRRQRRSLWGSPLGGTFYWTIGSSVAVCLHLRLIWTTERRSR